MVNNMKKNTKRRLNILSKEKKLITSLGVSELDIKEEYIYKVSEEKYSNSEPCIIIRGKIANQVFCMINQFFMECSSKGQTEFSLKELPPIFTEAIKWSEDAEYISIE